MEKNTLDPSPKSTSHRKALQINLDPSRYGSFAEIGAGQEVVRYFFRSGTVAKSMSAYDMIFSDEIYGKVDRYVSRERLEHMLDHEYQLLEKRLKKVRGKETCFFAFANTVATRSSHGSHESHGWMGIRFQERPGTVSSDVLIHIRMLDKSAVQQQAALGITGVNLIYGAFFLSNDIDRCLDSLRDNLESDRIEIDMLECNGPAFSTVDNRVVSIKLVEKGFTNAVLFGPRKQILQPSSFLRKKPIVLGRGGFRPVTHVNMDMLHTARDAFAENSGFSKDSFINLFEITLSNLRRTQESNTINYTDLLQRVDLNNTVGIPTLISNYFEYFRLSAYFRRYTNEPIGIVLGINNLLEIFNQAYYESLEGGILEAFGRLFKNKVNLYIYPMLRRSLLQYIELRYTRRDQEADQSFYQQKGSESHITINAHNVKVRDNLRNLYKYLLENHFIRHLEARNLEVMKVFPAQVLQMIREENPLWKKYVPETGIRFIEENQPFGKCGK